MIIPRKAAEIARFKGLGEISPDEFIFMIAVFLQLTRVHPRMALDPDRFFLLAHGDFLKCFQVDGLLDADDEIHTFFSEVVEGSVVAAQGSCRRSRRLGRPRPPPGTVGGWLGHPTIQPILEKSKSDSFVTSPNIQCWKRRNRSGFLPSSGGNSKKFQNRACQVEFDS